MSRSDALKRAQGMIDAAENSALTRSSGGIAKALIAAAQAQLALADRLAADEPEEAPAALGLLLKSLDDGSLAERIAEVLEQGSGRMLVPEMSQVVANVVRGVLHAAPTEQRLDAAESPQEMSHKLRNPESPEVDGKFFPSYRDASYRTTSEPLKPSEAFDEPEPDLGDGSREYCYLPKPGDARQGLRCTFWRGHKGMHTWQVRP